MKIIDKKLLCGMICYALDVFHDVNSRESLKQEYFYINDEVNEKLYLSVSEIKAIIFLGTFIKYDHSEIFKGNKIDLSGFLGKIFVEDDIDGNVVIEPLTSFFSRRLEIRDKIYYNNRKSEMNELLYDFDTDIDDDIEYENIILRIDENYPYLLRDIMGGELSKDYDMLIKNLKESILGNNPPFSDEHFEFDNIEDNPNNPLPLLSFLDKLFDSTSFEEDRRKSYIEQIGTNLNEKKYDYDPAIGRDEVIKQIAITLSTPNQSVMIIGPAGTGKSAIAEGLAYRINEERYLRGKKIIELDTSELVSGKALFGDFEENIQRIVKSAEENPEIILFIDEIHRLYKLGINESNAMNNLKKPISEGKIRIIGATTKEEFEDTIKEDSAFVDRFDIYTISELSDKWLKQIIEARINWLEEYYNIALNMDDAKLLRFINYLLKLTSMDNRKLNQCNHNPRLVIQLLDKIFATALINDHIVVEYDDVISSITGNNKISNKNYKMPNVFNDNEEPDVPKTLANVIDFNSLKRKTD